MHSKISLFLHRFITPPCIQHNHSGNTIETLDDCLAACEGHGYANWVPSAQQSCTCSQDCDGGYGPVVYGAGMAPVTVNAEVYALTPVRVI